MKVILSNGFGQFHLAPLAAQLHQRGRLGTFITGAYPLGNTTLLGRSARAERLRERRVDIPNDLVRSASASEIFYQAAQWLRSKRVEAPVDRLLAESLDSYAQYARREISHAPAAQIYHFRAGFGGASILAARQRGMKVICDHSLVHPRLLHGLVSETGERAKTLSRFWARVERDIDESDAIVVNSDFVAETMAEAGVAPARVHVAYTPVEAGFRATEQRRHIGMEPTVLFAGTPELRKGIDVVVAATKQSVVPPRAWKIVGDWDPTLSELRDQVPADVTMLPKLPRHELANELGRADIFVFPTRAEGSARVVAEALCMGAWVITTRNAGSVTRDGIDGRLVGVNDAEAISKAVDSYALLDAAERESRSQQTAEYARDRLSAARYVKSIFAAYESALSDGSTVA